jgi:general transcription factor 3C polypeptide 3 (transcription factor C subunit 4)
MANFQSHFSWLDPEDDGSGAKIFEYADLFKEAADALAAAGYPHKALSFYEPIQLIDDYKDLTIYFGMASCYRSVELFNQAEQSYSAVIIRDPSNVGARVQLAEMLEGLGRTEEALRYVNEVIESRREAARQRELEDDASDGDEQVGEGTFIPIAAGAREGAKKQRRPYEPKPGDRRFGPRNRRFREPKDVRLLHMKLQNLQDRVGMGDEEAINEWTETAKSMLAEFGFCKLFFPPERHVRFYGYSAEARRKSWKTTKLDKVDTLAGRLHAALGE